MSKLKIYCWTSILVLVIGTAACGGSGGDNAPDAVPTDMPPVETAVPIPDANTPTGRLFFVRLNDQTNQTELVQVDVASGELTTVFTPPGNGSILSADITDDGTSFVIGYAPPTAANEIQFGYTGLFTLPLNGSGEPQPLIEKEVPDAIYFNPIWSPDNQRIYYTHMGPDPTSEEGFFSVTLEQLNLATGERSVAAPDAIWPRVSPDGSRLTYAFSEPTSLRNELYVANADGSDAMLLLNLDDFLAVDSPLFSPDGRFITFSAVTEDSLVPQSTSWLDWLLGVKPAAAHAIPSDWWRIPADGSAPAERLTEVREVGLFGDFSPDGRSFAFITTVSLYIMDADGGNLTRMLDIQTVGGSLAWIP
ncbi:MAG: hypothetical protein ACE5FD_00475 [Anaerolineae bacterium]